VVRLGHFYCCEIGHASNKCYFKKCGVPEGKYKWISKKSSVLSNPTTKWVPRCILLVLAGFMKSLIINVIFFLGHISKDKFESFPASIMM